MSDDGAHGITIIAFVGSVFSPYYAWSRRRGSGDPENFVCLNVALYGRPRRWAMTERGRTALTRSADHLAIGPSALHWDGASLVVRIDERTAPLPSRLQGEVRVHPAALTRRSFALDDAGRHRWSPIAPVSRVEVALDRPGLRWSGPGYLDSNEGDRALEDDFVEWDWCRAPTPTGATILYNATRRTGGHQALALHVDRGGEVAPFAPPPPVDLPQTRWGLRRRTRAERPAAVRRTLEDAPFYARSVIETDFGAGPVAAVHESLNLGRFRLPIVQAMLPFRVPRWT